MSYRLNFEAEPFEGYIEFDEFEGFDSENFGEWSEEVRRRRAGPAPARFRGRPRRRPRWRRPRRPLLPVFSLPFANLRISPDAQGTDFAGPDGVYGEPTVDVGDEGDAVSPPGASAADAATDFDPAADALEFDELEWLEPEADEFEESFEWAGEVSRSSPEYIRWVQQSLNQIMGLRLAVDGDAGPQTRSAIRSFQKRRGLKEDGLVGGVTEQALIAAGAAPPPTTAAKTKSPPLPAVASVISPLADTRRGLRKGGRKRVLPVYGICVHTTSGGPARKAKANPGGKSALDRALDFYLKGNEGFPHYVVGYDGTIYGTCSENEIAFHAGWGRNGFDKWAKWKVEEWWGKVWRAQLGQNATPTSLLPPKARDPNSVYIGVEMLADTTGYGFTVAQYEALARLVSDIAKRHQLPITPAPSPRLLGHEDVDPISRGNKHGGWDPGAHRDKPMFSWKLLWDKIANLGAP